MGEWVLSRDFPDASDLMHIFALCPPSCKTEGGLDGYVTLGNTTEGREVDLGVFAGCHHRRLLPRAPSRDPPMTREADGSRAAADLNRRKANHGGQSDEVILAA